MSRSMISIKAVLGLTLIAGTGLAAAVLLKNSLHKTAPDDSSFLKATYAIRFTQRKPFSDQEMTVSDSNTVSRLLSSVRLERKRPCMCGHFLQATFQAPSGNTFVSFCNHCFDIQTTSNSYQGLRMYRMPKDFYAEFYKLVKTQTNGLCWRIHEP